MKTCIASEQVAEFWSCCVFSCFIDEYLRVRLFFVRCCARSTGVAWDVSRASAHGEIDQQARGRAGPEDARDREIKRGSVYVSLDA